MRLISDLTVCVQPHRRQPTRLLCPWGFSRQEYLSGLPCPPQWIFPTQGSNPGLLHCRQILYQLSHQGSPRILKWSPWVGPGKPNLPLGLRGNAGCGARVTAGPKRPLLCVCPGPNFPLQGRQGSRGCIPGSPGESGLVSRGSQGLRSPLDSRRG